ncbi:MAG: IS630 family transposase [Planctomycetota bacterium]
MANPEKGGVYFQKKTILPAEQERPDVKQARKDWHLSVKGAKARRLIFIDETWFSTAMARSRGYAPRGKRPVSRVPHGHWKTTTFVGGLTKSGIVAPMPLDGPINSDSFKAYVEQVLAPEIRTGDLVIMDNLSSHKTAQVRQALREKGIRVKYLPPYSPDLNPIENAFSKFKSMVRTAALRSIPDLWNSIGRLILKFRPAECANYLRHCGYGNPHI